VQKQWHEQVKSLHDVVSLSATGLSGSAAAGIATEAAIPTLLMKPATAAAAAAAAAAEAAAAAANSHISASIVAATSCHS